jgi:4-hydroxybenzoate polyprenyltransferase
MKFLDLFFAARPMLLLPVWSIYLVALHYHFELSGGLIGWSNVGMLAGISLVVSGAYYLNQMEDCEGDRLNKKLGFLQNDFISTRAMRIACLVTTLAGLVVSGMFSVFAAGLFVQAFLLGYLYSAPPFRLKDRPVWGLLSDGYCFGVLVPLAIMPHMSMHNVGLLGWDNPFYYFLAVAAVHILTGIPDREGDRATGKRTVAVWLPLSGAKLLALLFVVGSALVAFRSGHYPLLAVSVVSALTVLVSLFSASEKIVLLAAKLPVLLLTLLAGFFFWGYLVFVVALLFVTRIYYHKRFNLEYPKIA